MSNSPQSELRDLLILRYDDLGEQVTQLFELLNRDEAIRNVFFRDPVLVIRTNLPFLRDMTLSDQQNAIANRVLYSVLSNKEFMKFLDSYQRKKSKAISRVMEHPHDEAANSEIDPDRVRAELAGAVLKYGDRELIYNLLGAYRGSTTHNSSLACSDVDLVLQVHVLVAMVLFVTGNLQLCVAGYAAEGMPRIPGSELRSIADQLVDAANQARIEGFLALW